MAEFRDITDEAVALMRFEGDDRVENVSPLTKNVEDLLVVDVDAGDD